MRRESRNSETNSNQVMKKRLYLIGSILAIGIIAFFVTILVYGNKVNKEASLSKMNTEKITDLISNNTVNTQNQENRLTEEASTSIGKTVEEAEKEEKIAINTSVMNETVNTNTTKVNTKKETTENTAQVDKKVDEKKKTEEKKDPTFAFPVQGDIIKEYAKDNLVYSQTLGEWITHAGIDIKAENTTVVKAAADGKVKAIKNDPRYGLTIILEHDNGFTSVYANLLTSEFVVEGENVKQGQSIGTVGNTATFEIADESHLHFEILKDNNQVDPNVYLK